MNSEGQRQPHILRPDFFPIERVDQFIHRCGAVFVKKPRAASQHAENFFAGKAFGEGSQIRIAVAFGQTAALRVFQQGDVRIFGRFKTVEERMSCPRTISLTPLSASSTTTAS